MEKNVGNTDRIVRAVLAVILAVLYFSSAVTGTLGIILLALGGILLLTSAIGICPLYLPFKFSTRKA